MPFTPFHLGFALPVWYMFRDKLHFASICIGSMIPDLEVLWMAPFTNELGHAGGYLHSLYGAVTIDLAITLFFVYMVVPPFGRWLKRRVRRKGGEKWHIFAGTDMTAPPKRHGWAIVSALIGTLSHVTIDLFTHVYNPIFWPHFINENINLMPIEGRWESSILFMIPLGAIVIYMAARHWTRKD